MGRTRGIHQISINNPQKSAGFESHHRIIAFCHNPSSNQLLLAPKYTKLIKPSNFSDKAQDHKTKDNCARLTTKHVKVYQALVRQTDRQNLFPGCPYIKLPDGRACLKIEWRLTSISLYCKLHLKVEWPMCRFFQAVLLFHITKLAQQCSIQHHLVHTDLIKNISQHLCQT